MKKFLILIAALSLTIALAGCGSEDTEKLPELPDTVAMADLDDYLGRPDVQYVDLRDFDERMYNGYIQGFEALPFKGYLEKMDILVRTDGNWDWAAEDTVDGTTLATFFDADKAIFLMCAGGTRAGYVKAALEAEGFTNVYNLGGFPDYTGTMKVTGDAAYNVEVQLPLPAEVTLDNIDMYLGRTDVQYVDLRNFDERMYNGYVMGFEALPFKGYLEPMNILVRTDGNWEWAAEDTVDATTLATFFDADKAIFLMCAGGTRAGYVKAALEAQGFTRVYNIGGFGQYDGDYKVFGDEAYKITVDKAGDYTAGTYYGYSEGYSALITVGPNGAIVDVFLDAVHKDRNTGEFFSFKKGYTSFDQYPMNYVVDDNGTPLDDSDDFVTNVIVEGKLDWWQQAAALEDAILAEQGWVWTLVEGDFGVDGVAGVSIGVGGWEAAVEAALTAATPAS